MKYYKKLILSLFTILLPSLGFALTSNSLSDSPKPKIENIEDIKNLLASIDLNGMEDHRLDVLKELPIHDFATLLGYFLTSEGGNAIKHWVYNPTFSTNELSDYFFYNREHTHPLGFEPDYFYITPPTLALQYILFFLEYNAIDADEKNSRAQKVAETLSLLNQDIAIDILYGRFDTRFLRKNDRLTPESELPKKLQPKATLRDKSTKKFWLYEAYQIKDNKKIYKKQRSKSFYQNTIQARLPLPFVRILIPYLNKDLLAKMAKKEDYLASQNLRIEL